MSENCRQTIDTAIRAWYNYIGFLEELKKDSGDQVGLFV
jgi:hypothetical protein